MFTTPLMEYILSMISCVAVRRKIIHEDEAEIVEKKKGRPLPYSDCPGNTSTPPILHPHVLGLGVCARNPGWTPCMGWQPYIQKHASQIFSEDILSESAPVCQTVEVQRIPRYKISFVLAYIILQLTEAEFPHSNDGFVPKEMHPSNTCFVIARCGWFMIPLNHFCNLLNVHIEESFYKSL